MFKTGIKYTIAGILAGLANGFFGAAGGIILVSLLTHWAGMEERRAFATSLFVMLPMCIISAIIYLLHEDFAIWDALPFLIGGLIGGFVGGRVFAKVPVQLLRKAFALLIIYGGIRSVLS